MLYQQGYKSQDLIISNNEYTTVIPLSDFKPTKTWIFKTMQSLQRFFDTFIFNK